MVVVMTKHYNIKGCELCLKPLSRKCWCVVQKEVPYNPGLRGCSVCLHHSMKGFLGVFFVWSERLMSDLIVHRVRRSCVGSVIVAARTA